MKTFQYEQKMYGSIFVKNLGSTNIKKKLFYGNWNAIF